jgi:UDP-glucose 4-epimerase
MLPLTSFQEKRDFIYIDDVIDAYELAMQKKFEGCPVFNVGTGIEHSLADVIGCIEEKVGKKMKVKEGAYRHRPWRSSCWAADIRSTKKILGWKPKHSLKPGISNVIAKLADEIECC